ncbi:MAG TPA: hypothetical protein VKQ72_14400 [Aggregatilineales bacterium]|nr:hypothetical protein [Aggregatilineales bacterium]
MRFRITSFTVAFIAIALFVFKTSAPLPVSAQAKTCTDQTVMNPILDTFNSASGVFQNLPQATKLDDFATIIDTGIKARQSISDLKIDPTSPCFLVQVVAVQLESDQNDYASYALLAHLGATNAQTYQSNLDTIRARTQTDLQTLNTYTGLGGTPAAQ